MHGGAGQQLLGRARCLNIDLMLPRISIVIPALDEEAAIPLLLADLHPLGRDAELIVCDGGSVDQTVAIAGEGGARVLHAPRGRSSQLRAGADAATAPVLLFLHADSRVPDAALRRIASLGPGDGWGFFRPVLVGQSGWLPLVSRCMGWRSRLSGIATGDQGLFVSRSFYDAVGGFPEQPLMEDIELCARLRRIAWPRALPEALISSGRRWDRDGALRTIFLMWRLRLLYRLGADPRALHEAYYDA